jgi:uncharacterized protein YjeT (DUF2065 family)
LGGDGVDVDAKDWGAVMHDLLAAMCLVLVIEGLFLFAAPGTWQRMVEQMRQLEPRHLRMIGGVMVGVGVLALKLVN